MLKVSESLFLHKCHRLAISGLAFKTLLLAHNCTDLLQNSLSRPVNNHFILIDSPQQTWLEDRKSTSSHIWIKTKVSGNENNKFSSSALPKSKSLRSSRKLPTRAFRWWRNLERIEDWHGAICCSQCWMLRPGRLDNFHR